MFNAQQRGRALNREAAIETRSTRRAVNISLEARTLSEAKALGINISRACQRGLEAQIVRVRRETWLADNGPALDASNVYVEAKGLPLASLRQF